MSPCTRSDSSAEKGRFRLTHQAVQKGFGKRHDNPKKYRYPFDEISILSQKVIADNWHWVVTDFDQEKHSKPILREAFEALVCFKKDRRSEMTTQMEVCWLRDQFPKPTQDEIVTLINIPQSLANRYAKLCERQREYLRGNAKAHVLSKEA